MLDASPGFAYLRGVTPHDADGRGPHGLPALDGPPAAAGLPAGEVAPALLAVVLTANRL